MGWFGVSKRNHSHLCFRDLAECDEKLRNEPVRATPKTLSDNHAGRDMLCVKVVSCIFFHFFAELSVSTTIFTEWPVGGSRWKSLWTTGRLATCSWMNFMHGDSWISVGGTNRDGDGSITWIYCLWKCILLSNSFVIHPYKI